MAGEQDDLTEVGLLLTVDVKRWINPLTVLSVQPYSWKSEGFFGEHIEQKLVK